jgi:hypothetical protein
MWLSPLDDLEMQRQRPRRLRLPYDRRMDLKLLRCLAEARLQVILPLMLSSMSLLNLFLPCNCAFRHSHNYAMFALAFSNKQSASLTTEQRRCPLICTCPSDRRRWSTLLLHLR